MSTASLDERCAALEADYQRCVESDPIARCLEFDTVPTDLFECERCACQACACEGACSREYERWRSCLKTCRDRGDQERAACEGECDGAVESVLADSLGCFSENGVQACLSLCQP